MNQSIQQQQYRASVRHLAPASAPAFGGGDDNDNDAGESVGAAEEDAKEGEEGGGGGSSSYAGEEDEDSDEEPDAPPLKRGIVSSQGMSHGASSSGGGSYSRGGEAEEAGPRWEPNMELDLAEFDQDSVTYLAEVSFWRVVQCSEVKCRRRSEEVAAGCKFDVDAGEGAVRCGGEGEGGGCGNRHE